MDKWNKVYVQNLPIYMQLIEKHFEYAEIEKRRISVERLLDKLSFKLPKGLTKKEIKEIGRFPVVSQSKEMIVGYSDFEENVISTDLPLIIYGDHSKTIKFIDFPFVIGADGVKLLKPKKYIDPKYFYFSLIGLETDTKNYGRHFSLLKKKLLAIPSSLEVQYKVVKFVEDLKVKEISKDESYFSSQIEKIIESLQSNSITVLELNDELTHQQTLLKKLRQQILQEGIEGKLTADWRAQNPDVEPAGELLKRIAAEKAQLVKDKKIKAQKPLPPITNAEKPFDLPPGWEWCRTGILLNKFSTGPFGSMLHKSDYVTDGIPLVNPANIANEQIVPSSKMMIDEKTRQRLSRYILQTGNLVVARRGDLSKCAVVSSRESGWLCGTGSFFLQLSEFIYGDFFVRVYRSSFFQRFLVECSIGQTMSNLNQKILNKVMMPLPPLEEQKAIVTKVEKLLALCDQLETKITQNQAHAEQLMQAVLKEAFGHNREAALQSV